MAGSAKSGGAMEKSLLDAVEASDVAEASKLVAKDIRQGIDPILDPDEWRTMVAFMRNSLGWTQDRW